MGEVILPNLPNNCKPVPAQIRCCFWCISCHFIARWLWI